MRTALAVLLLAVLLLAVLPLVATSAFAQDAPATNPHDEFTKAFFFGKKFADLGEYASAYEQFAKADALEPDQAPVLYDMAVVLARAGRYSDAQVKVDRYLQLFPSGAERANVAKLQLELEFQRELQKKRQTDQEYADLFNRAKFTYAHGDLGEALRLFQQAEQLRASDAAAVFDEAVVLEKQGEFAKAIERYRRYAELETNVEKKTSVDERIFALQHELEDMRTKIVCAFCGYKLPAGATWCPRCWHGPYLVKSAVWNTRPCVDGASATRATYFSDERFNRNDVLPCLWKNGSMLETLRYTPSRQRAIQEARRAEGWTYANDVLQNWSDRQGNQIRYTQGADYCEKISSTSGGEVLTYTAHAGGDGIWLLDREDLIVDAQRYTNHYEYDAAGRIARQQVSYENGAACNHVIDMTADYAYANDALVAATIKGGYDGYTPEGAPRVDWQASVAYTYDANARVMKEELAVTSFSKTYTQKAQGALRDEVSQLYANMRVRKPIENVSRSGDLCGASGNQLLTNLIDLRPFYALSPNLAIALQNGVTRAVVTFTYPDAFRP
ncbi:MAG: tetratricopeptide repeat protein [Acidobacteria bacterium]|nr:tetratricopeptide repeat protein [Acidobacteriota bacterium]MBV9477322.1 tetratricopeptide repeat protein [Acidobacteriota bacterium]